MIAEKGAGRVVNSCCFTGHRSIPLSELAPLTAHLDQVLSTVYGMGCRTFYAGGAMGFDALAAARVLLLRETHPDVRLFLVLPCRDQHRFWSAADIARHEEQLRHADAFLYVAESYSPRVMQERNEALVAHADVCVAYARRPASGAGQTVRLAERAGKPVINLADRFAPADENPC